MEDLDPLEPLVARALPGGEICTPFGWDQILIDLDQDLAQVDPDYKILQAKEKFGTLRFYWQHSPGQTPKSISKFQELVLEAEAKSAETCEQCGAPGELRIIRRWHRTLCETCKGDVS